MTHRAEYLTTAAIRVWTQRIASVSDRHKLRAQSRPDRTTDRFRQPWSKQSRVANVMNGWSWTTGGAGGRLEKAAEQTFYIDVIERRYSATSARERRSSSPALTFSPVDSLALNIQYSNQHITTVRLRNGNYWTSKWDYTIV